MIVAYFFGHPVHGKNCHAAPEQTTSSHVPRQRKLLPRSTNVQPVFDILGLHMSITGCTFVDMDGGGSFLCRHVTRSGLFWYGVPILQVF